MSRLMPLAVSDAHLLSSIPSHSDQPLCTVQQKLIRSSQIDKGHMYRCILEIIQVSPVHALFADEVKRVATRDVGRNHNNVTQAPVLPLAHAGEAKCLFRPTPVKCRV